MSPIIVVDFNDLGAFGHVHTDRKSIADRLNIKMYSFSVQFKAPSIILRFYFQLRNRLTIIRLRHSCYLLIFCFEKTYYDDDDVGFIRRGEMERKKQIVLLTWKLSVCIYVRINESLEYSDVLKSK